MATASVLDAAIERHHIHMATCRARRAGLVCGTCSELAGSSERAVRQAAGTIVREAA